VSAVTTADRSTQLAVNEVQSGDDGRMEFDDGTDNVLATDFNIQGDLRIDVGDSSGSKLSDNRGNTSRHDDTDLASSD
jgi:hypothetical protein